MVVENRPAPDDSRVWPEAITLRDQGFQVSIISPMGERRHDESYCCIDGIRIYRYRLPTGNTVAAYVAEYLVAFIRTFRLSLRIWLQHGFDVIHVANPPDVFFLMGLFYRFFGVKFVFDQHDLAPQMFQVLFAGRIDRRAGRLMHSLLLFLERCSYRVADAVVVVNRSCQQLAVARGRCRAYKVAIVRNGPRLADTEPVSCEPELKMGRRYLLAYVGVMGVQDGVHHALRALHTLVHQRGRRDVALVLMGDGTEGPALLALAHELNLDAYVKFTGWTMREDIQRYLSAADVGLSPDPRNALNDVCTMVKTLEYMALGKPVVAFDLSETRLAVQGAALYAIPNVVEDFADKIETLLDNEDLRARMGALGRQRIEETLAWEHSQAQLLRVYRRLLGEWTTTEAQHAALPSDGNLENSEHTVLTNVLPSTDGHSATCEGQDSQHRFISVRS
jgi:glycosyltransferase involved in cell wall biosynthesis